MINQTKQKLHCEEYNETFKAAINASDCIGVDYMDELLKCEGDLLAVKSVFIMIQGDIINALLVEWYSSDEKNAKTIEAMEYLAEEIQRLTKEQTS